MEHKKDCLCFLHALIDLVEKGEIRITDYSESTPVRDIPSPDQWRQVAHVGTGHISINYTFTLEEEVN